MIAYSGQWSNTMHNRQVSLIVIPVSLYSLPYLTRFNVNAIESIITVRLESVQSERICMMKVDYLGRSQDHLKEE